MVSHTVTQGDSSGGLTHSRLPTPGVFSPPVPILNVLHAASTDSWASLRANTINWGLFHAFFRMSVSVSRER